MATGKRKILPTVVIKKSPYRQDFLQAGCYARIIHVYTLGGKPHKYKVKPLDGDGKEYIFLLTEVQEL